MPWPGRIAALIAVACAVSAADELLAQSKDVAKPYVVEYYYKVKWGSFDEFFRLFKKNHYPVLMKEKELGRILRVDAARPRLHGTEDGRWDLRVTITWRDAATANDDFDPATITSVLYPDKAAFEREEQQRFALLLAHWDLPIRDAILEK
ncbi:MAG TPA: hypothetical protein VFV24_03030 [Candidatus Eisenbacteria bacterium]|nr:hypothetical protein [Candidatus Eisenbacteria bacterium]